MELKEGETYSKVYSNFPLVTKVTITGRQQGEFSYSEETSQYRFGLHGLWELMTPIDECRIVKQYRSEITRKTSRTAPIYKLEK